MTPAELILERDYILLDFDGPVCAVFGKLSKRTVADRLKPLLGSELSDDVADTDDPFAVLRYAGMVGPTTAAAVERQLRRLEAEAVTTAPPTPGAAGAIRGLAASGCKIAIVSNNSTSAVRTYLTMHDLVGAVRSISARDHADPSLLKPSPYLLREAIEALGTTPEHCVMVGDSIGDIEAAHAVPLPVIAYANKPGKRDRFAPYRPDAIIEYMTQLCPTRLA